MRLADVLTPAIGYARNGYPLVERIGATIDTVKDAVPRALADLRRGLSAGRQGADARHAVHQSDAGRHLRAHPARGRERRRRPRGARSSAPRKAWSQGFVAEAIDRFCRTQEVMDISGRRHRGVLTADDMAKWQATVEAPIGYDYGRYTVLKAGPGPRGW